MFTLTKADFTDGSFTSVAKYLQRHWPSGEIKLSQAREILARCLGHQDVFHAEKAVAAERIGKDIEDGRAAVEAVLLSEARVPPDKAGQLAQALPLWKLSCFRHASELQSLTKAANPPEPTRDGEIIVVEIPHQSQPTAWLAKNQADFFSRVDEANVRSGRTIFEEATARKLAEIEGLDPDKAEDDESEFAGRVRDLAARHGWDTPLYRADYIEDGAYTAEPIDMLEAFKAAVADDLSSCLFFDGFEEARRALDDPANWNGHGGAGARNALLRLLSEASELPEDTVNETALADKRGRQEQEVEGTMVTNTETRASLPGALTEEDFNSSEPNIAIERVVDGKRFNTSTAFRICDLPCPVWKNDFSWHDTALYVTPAGRFFLAGEGNGRSRWRERVGSGFNPGRGIEPVSHDEARRFMEEANCSPDEFERVGLVIEDA